MRGLIPFVVALAAIIGMTRVARNEVTLIDGSWIAVMSLAALAVLAPMKAEP